jgi:hypothetical protein
MVRLDPHLLWLWQVGSFVVGIKEQSVNADERRTIE